MRKRTVFRILASISTFILLLCQVYADPISPPPPPPLNWIDYSIEVIVSEAVALIIGAELLLRLLRKRKQEVTRVECYRVMLVAMIVSFSIGLLFWKIFGWI